MSSGGKGGSKSGSSLQYSSTQLPDWLNSASQQAISQAEDLSTRAYTPYTGEMVAGTTADTQQAYQDVRNMQGMTDPAFNAAQGAWGGVLGNLQSLTPGQIQGMTNQLYGGYGQDVIAPAAGLLGGYMTGGPATAQQVGQNTMSLMTPFASSVLAPAMQLGQQTLASNLQNIGASADKAGAFGGSRQGVQEGVAQAQAALQMAQYGGNLLNTGWNAALTPATQLALQQGSEGYGAATNLAGLLGTGYSGAQTQAGNIATTNLGLGTQAAQQIPGLAVQQAGEAQKEASMMQTIGAAEQNQQQAIDNAAMGQFYEAQNWPVQNLDYLLSAVGSVPYGSTTTSYGTTTQNQSRNVAGSALGGAASGASIGSAFGPMGTGIGAVAGGILGAL